MRMKTVLISKFQNQTKRSGSRSSNEIKNVIKRFYRHIKINAGVYALSGNAVSGERMQNRKLKMSVSRSSCGWKNQMTRFLKSGDRQKNQQTSDNFNTVTVSLEISQSIYFIYRSCLPIQTITVLFPPLIPRKTVMNEKL